MSRAKLKLYIYPEAQPHDHDTNKSGMAENLENTVPMSRLGIKKHFEVSSPENADYFFMGQFPQDSSGITKYSPADFGFFAGNESRHICDIDGEGGFEFSRRPAIPSWLYDSVITANGVPKTYSRLKNIFPRPTFSQLLIDIIKNREEDFVFPTQPSFGLRCFLNHDIRALLVYVLHKSDFQKDLHINKSWEGLASVGTDIHQRFIETMLNNSISLCPRGSGIDSVRLYETCYYKRVPVLISDRDYFLLGEGTYDTDFCFRICDKDMTPQYLKESLVEIYNTPIQELERRAIAARKYFDLVVRKYFEDPTLFFLKWLERNNAKK